MVRAYADFAAKTGTRLTFFINGSYDSFEQNLDVLAPLVTSGQIQIGNHTWSHAALTDLDDAGIIEELEKNDREIERLFGMSSKPYFRPPYGYYDRRVLDAAARAGFDRPTLWYGSLAESSPITSEEIYKYASTYANPQTILIGHLNYTGVIAVLDKIKALLDERGLVTVTLRDYYGG
ncbi:polysaccharide deacetylase family protein [Rothia aeria]|uniref:polysaccharide deacetylase family protein n=1 Tax=Rothia aeria TaxID=172042 RepID=UPI0028E2EF6B|nr:polysaccharide deacetylase family protein [Rothia aeria]